MRAARRMLEMTDDKETGVRVDVVVDLSRRDGGERVVEAQGGLPRPPGTPDVVQTGATDAAGEMGVELEACAD